ncbi:MAG: hypothetical protein SFW67_33825 [Myxococcaceae bacterium]|nr:hypothetical protein [Myxococcaceae bacterium]
MSRGRPVAQGAGPGVGDEGLAGGRCRVRGPLPGLLAGLLAVASGCGRSDVLRFDDAALEPPPPARDAGRDAGRVDAGLFDAGTRDAGAPDAGAPDAGAPDAGSCPTGFARVGDTCIEVAAALDGLRWELPCFSLDRDFPQLICFTHAIQRTFTTLRGVPGRQYDVRVRVRGVIETRGYRGGRQVAPFVVEGAESAVMPVDADPWNIYRLEVSDPPQTFALNAGLSGEYRCHVVDATFTVRASSGAVVTLFASSVDGNRSQIRNVGDAGVPLVAPEVPPAPMAFDGQFLQVDVLGVSAASP